MRWRLDVEAGGYGAVERRLVVLDDRGEVGVDVEVGVGFVDAVGADRGEHVATDDARLADEGGRVEVVDVDLELLVGQGQDLLVLGDGVVAAAGQREGSLAVADHLIAHALGHRREDLLGDGRAGLDRVAADLSCCTSRTSAAG
ncbi:MAG: hypothetical protein E6J91_06840 [Deltaproteobacteria bacterium]|nr:MAG: hypothetical protein E6J91_06840 [Deltaproteobacteria bacterium]